MLIHTWLEWDIVVLAPSTKWVKQKDWVLVSTLDKLFTSILEEEHVTIVEWVADLEAIDSISTTGLNLFGDLTWGESILVEAIVELDLVEEASALRAHEPVSLSHDGLGLGVLG